MKKWLVVSIVLIMMVIGLLFIPFKSSLVFYKENTEDISAYIPLKSGEAFQIIFVHSIHLTDVTEKYEITEDKQIKQSEMIFSDFGIGMPSEVKEHEEIFYEDDFYHLVNMDNQFASMKIRNGKTVSKHRFIWEQKGRKHMIKFNDYFEPGAWFTVKSDKLSMLDMWKEVKIHE